MGYWHKVAGWAVFWAFSWAYRISGQSQLCKCFLMVYTLMSSRMNGIAGSSGYFGVDLGKSR
jgi:hypothetical protein